MGRGRYDGEDEGVRIRPQRGKSRPRTKDRPTHVHADTGLVLAVDRGRYTCLVPLDAPADEDRQITAMKARELGRKGVVVGDHVGIVGDTTGDEGSLARIVRVEPRRTVLRRSADDTDPVERVIVANAQQLVIVTALADPEPRPRLIDRCLVAAYDAGMTPLLCLTKADLADPADLLAAYAPLGVPYVVTRRGESVEPVVELLRGTVSVFIGQSGVGKSTLVNAVVPSAERTTGVVNDVTGRGRHTSTSTVVLPVPGGGWVIDTPGIRSFGLAHVDPQQVLGSFPDLYEVTQSYDGGCPRGCTHAESEPECALDAAVAAGALDAVRVASYRRLLSSREGPDEQVHAPR